MATTKKTPKATGDDTPVSNKTEEAAPAVDKNTQPPSEGINPKTVPPTKEGIETVEGFSFRETDAESEAETVAVADLPQLRDIGEASFGPPPAIPAPTGEQAENVHGDDNRVKITTTASYPWRAIASLLITAADNSMWIGTGWFIGPHTLITAGHVVFIKNSGVPGRDGWVKKIQVMPGRDGSAMPYGSVVSTDFHSVTGWTNNGDENYDYGAIIIPTDMGKTTGWFGFGVYSDSDLKNAVGNISGYPGDKPTGTQWYDARRIDSVNSRKVFYDIDTAGGQSGSAVYRIINGSRMAIAIHAYGGVTTNSGTRIGPNVYKNMLAWKA